MKNFLIALIISLFPLWLASQQVAVYNLYTYNTNFINPAATGLSNCKTFTLTDRHQWLGIKGAPAVQTFSAQLPKQFHKHKKHGLGLNIVHDVNGATQNLGGEFLYAFHFAVGRRNTTLSLGLSGKFGQYTFDERDFTELIADPVVTRSREMELYYNASSGIFLYAERLFCGIAIYNLLPVSTNYYKEYGNESYFATGIVGYTFNPFRNDIELKSAVYGAMGNSMFQVDLNNIIEFDNNLKTGLIFRKYIGEFVHSSQNLLVLLGYELNSWCLNYTYDIGISSLQANHYGSHQISLTYRICADKYDCPTYNKY